MIRAASIVLVRGGFGAIAGNRPELASCLTPRRVFEALGLICPLLVLVAQPRLLHRRNMRQSKVGLVDTPPEVRAILTAGYRRMSPSRSSNEFER